MNFTLGGTLTGGTSTTLTPAGLSSGGKASYTAPGHTRLEPQLVDFLVKQAVVSKSEPGVARSGMKVAFANRVEAEGCCNVIPGTVICDVDIRWPLSQPETLVDDVIAYVRGLVWTTAFADAIKKGILPVS